ncbi:hypothetical protein Tco_1414874 [Tanacetum coccineum]
MANAQGEQPPAQELMNVEQAPPVNEECSLVLHASVEKSSEENTSKKIVLMFDNGTTEDLSKTTSSIFSPSPPREPTPPRDESKGKDEQLTNEDVMAQVKKIKRLVDLNAEKEKSEKSLQKIINPATIRAQAQKMAEYDAKRKNMLDEYNHQISHRIDQLPIKDTRFSEWLKVHALASKSKDKSNDLLLQSLKAKFEWVITQAKKLGVPPLPELSTFGISVDDTKRKRSSEILQEVFVKENVVVDRMHRNIIPPPGVEGR